MNRIRQIGKKSGFLYLFLFYVRSPHGDFHTPKTFYVLELRDVLYMKE
jgi:hypothetical protein